MYIFKKISFLGATEEKFFFEKKSPKTSRIQRLNSIPCQCDNTPEESKEEFMKEILDDVIEKVIALSTKQQKESSVEIDCTEPEIKVSPRRTVEIDISDPPASGDSSSRSQRRKRSSRMKSVEEEASSSTSNPSRGSSAPIALPLPSRYVKFQFEKKRRRRKFETFSVFS